MNVGHPIQFSRCNCLTQMLFLVQFAQTYLSFRLPELDSVIEMNGLKKEDVYSMYVFLRGNDVYRSDYNKDSPFMIINLPNESYARSVGRIRGIRSL